MSGDVQLRRADHVAYRLYPKLAQLVSNARATVEPDSNGRIDKWFNLETPHYKLFEKPISPYRTISSAISVPIFQIQVLLCIPKLAPNQVLRCIAPDFYVRVEPAPRFIMLESWDLEFIGHPDGHAHTDAAPPAMYKHAISLFRGIFTLLRVLPAWQLARRLRERACGGTCLDGGFSILLRLDNVNDGISPNEIMTFDNTPASLATVLQNERHSLPSIAHPVGELSFSVTYLLDPKFDLETTEALHPPRFPSGDSDLTPTSLPGGENARTPLSLLQQLLQGGYKQDDEPENEPALYDSLADPLDLSQWSVGDKTRWPTAGVGDSSFLDSRAMFLLEQARRLDGPPATLYDQYNNSDVDYASSTHGLWMTDLAQLSTSRSEYLPHIFGSVPPGTSLEDFERRQGASNAHYEVAIRSSTSLSNMSDDLAQSASVPRRIRLEDDAPPQWLYRMEDVPMQGISVSTTSTDWGAGIGWGSLSRSS